MQRNATFLAFFAMLHASMCSGQAPRRCSGQVPQRAAHEVSGLVARRRVRARSKRIFFAARTDSLDAPHSGRCRSRDAAKRDSAQQAGSTSSPQAGRLKRAGGRPPTSVHHNAPNAPLFDARLMHHLTRSPLEIRSISRVERLPCTKMHQNAPFFRFFSLFSDRLTPPACSREYRCKGWRLKPPPRLSAPTFSPAPSFRS